MSFAYIFCALATLLFTIIYVEFRRKQFRLKKQTVFSTGIVFFAKIFLKPLCNIELQKHKNWFAKNA